MSKLSRLGAVLNVPLENSRGPTYLFPNKTLVEQERQSLLAEGWNRDKLTLGVHISARCPMRVWPEAYFVTLIKKIVAATNVQIVLLWCPGLLNNPKHP